MLTSCTVRHSLLQYRSHSATLRHTPPHSATLRHTPPQSVTVRHTPPQSATVHQSSPEFTKASNSPEAITASPSHSFLDLLLIYLLFLVSLLVAAWFFFVVTVIMIVVGYNIIPIVFERLPLDIRDNIFYLRGLSWQFANDDDSIYEVGIR